MAYPSNTALPQGTPSRRWVLGTFTIGLIFYWLTASPGVGWSDSATFQIRIWRMDVSGREGWALAHPLYILLSRAFAFLPLGDFAYRVNLFCALCSAATLALAMQLTWRMCGSRAAATISIVLLALSHTFWRHSVTAEVYALYGACLLGELVLIERWFTTRGFRWLLAAAALNGLSISNHLLAGLHVPVYAVMLILELRTRRLRIMQVFGVLVIHLIGSSLYWGLVLRDVVHGTPISEAIRSALFGTGFQNQVLNVAMNLRSTLKVLSYFVLNFPTPLIFLAPFGLRTFIADDRTRGVAWVMAGIFAIEFVFAFRYPVADQYVFFFSCYVIVALWTSGCAAWLEQRASRKTVAFGLALLPALVYEVLPPVVSKYHIKMPYRHDTPYRNPDRYFLRPRLNGDHGADQFAREALQTASPDGLLIADSTLNGPLVYTREVLKVWPSVAISMQSEIVPQPPTSGTDPESIRPFARRGTAYLCGSPGTFAPPWMSAEYSFEPVGAIYRLAPKHSGH